MNATCHPFSLSLHTPFSTSGDEITRRDGFVLRLEAGDHVGYGEATPLPGWTESFRRCELTLERCIDHLENDDVATALSTGDAAPATRHAVDLATQDIRAQRAGVSLVEYLGGDPRVESVPVNATIGVSDPDDTVAAATRLVDAGFECLKLKVGTDHARRDATRVNRVRDAIPDAIDVRVDANAAWATTDVDTFLETVDVAGLDYLEQPLAVEDLTGHAALRDRGVPIALDESLTTHGIEDILAAGAADAVVLKPMAIGGIERTYAMATTAATHGVDPVVSTTHDAAIARVAATHLAAAIPTTRAAGLATGSNFETDLATDAPHIQEGVAALPEGNGNGVGPDTADDE